jgi:DTW domain-containing protein YfiP
VHLLLAVVRAVPTIPRPLDATEPTGRALCYRCMRPVAMCLCALVKPVRTKTKLVVLQHPKERRHPFGTARLMRLAMPDAIIETVHGGFDEVLRHEIDVAADAAVLYPHKDAVDLATMPRDQLPSTLVLLDGTWSHAKKLYQHNEWVQRLRHVRIDPPKPSNYRIRKEPQEDFVSTVEALVYALSILEPENEEPQSLLSAFDRMIDRQIDVLDVVQKHGRQKRERNKESRRLSPCLQSEDLVVCYGESALPGGDPSGLRELVQWAAVRLRDGALFDELIRPAQAWPSDDRLSHMGFTRADLERASPLAEVRARFEQFAGTDSPVCAWTKTTLDWASGMLDASRPRAVLKIDYSNLRSRRASYCESMMEREGLPESAVAARGRAGLRLGNAVVVAQWLRQQRVEPG